MPSLRTGHHLQGSVTPAVHGHWSSGTQERSEAEAFEVGPTSRRIPRSRCAHSLGSPGGSHPLHPGPGLQIHGRIRNQVKAIQIHRAGGGLQSVWHRWQKTLILTEVYQPVRRPEAEPRVENKA